MGYLNKIANFISDPFGIEGLKKESAGFHQRMSIMSRKVVDKLDKISNDANDIESIKSKYESKLREVTKRAKLYCISLNSFGDTVSDMAWMKWVDGTYAWANTKIIDELLFTGTMSNTIGRTDSDIGNRAIKEFGCDNHDFGSYCAGSDEITIEAGKQMRFLEFGFSGGKPLVLDVTKTPIRDSNGSIIGTTGIGKDVTDIIFSLIEISRSSTDDATTKHLERLINEHVYLGDKHEATLFEFYDRVKGKV